VACASLGVQIEGVKIGCHVCRKCILAASWPGESYSAHIVNPENANSQVAQKSADENLSRRLSGFTLGVAHLSPEESRWSAMTKSDLIEHVAELNKVSKGRAEALVNAIFECLEEALRRDERVEIRGLGSFETRRYGAYKGRNPRTGDSVAVRPKRLPFFKAGKELKDLINGNLRRTQEMPAIEMGDTLAAAEAEAEPRTATSSRGR
jgi:integration host factor subunit beta